MGPYLIHPDKLEAVHNVLLKQKARKSTKAKAAPSAPAANGNLVLKLMQQEYVKRQQTTGRSY